MLSTLWNTLLIQPIVNSLVFLYSIFGNLGVAIIILTIIIRTILLPLVIPSVKVMNKQRELKPELDNIKKKYKHDKKLQAEKQMALFKEHGINPASGCLSQLAMFIVLIALFTAIRTLTVDASVEAINNLLYFPSLKLDSGQIINTSFLYLNLSKPDPIYIFAILSGLLQYVASKMLMPYVEEAEKAAEKTPAPSDDIALQMQQNTLIMMPIMNFIFGLTLPAGVMLYLIVTTIYQIVQTYYLSGWGGFYYWIKKLKSGKKVA